MPAIAGKSPLKHLKPGMGLYQVFYWPKQAPDKTKPWALANLETGDVNGRWHATKEEALAQARALYARLGDKAKVHSEYVCFADTAQVADDGITWLEAIAAKTYHTPTYGPVEVGEQKILNFVKNFHSNVRGQEVAINYDHGIDVSKGNKAAGWIRDAVFEDGKLKLGIDFTKNAKDELKNKEWKYFSLEWDDEWTNNEGAEIVDVIVGGALTNRPIAKGLMPINFSELFEETADLEFAVWTTAYINNLPDSAFLYVESGGKKDAEGKTVPRSLRHLPYKDSSGNIDLPHLRNAIARAPQMTGTDDATKKRLQSKAQAILASHGGSMGEVASQEHTEPGISSPPPERLDDESGIREPDRLEGWRRDTPPIALDPGHTFSELEARGYLSASLHALRREEGNKELTDRIEVLLDTDRAEISLNELTSTLNEVRSRFRNDKTDVPSKGGYTVGELTEKDLRELRNVLDVDDDNKIVEAVKVRFGELSALRDAVSASEQEKLFAEQYPQFWQEHNRLMERDRHNAARTFSESVSRIRKAEGYGLKDTRQGLSVAALEKVIDVHKKFAEGTASVEDFEECMKAIVHGGIVEFGEIGSSADDAIPDVDTTTTTGVANARKVFAEVIDRVQKEHPEWSYLQCIDEASKKAPDLAQSYKITLPA